MSQFLRDFLPTLIYVTCFSVYLNKHLKFHVTNIVSDNFFINKIRKESFLIFEI